MKYERHQGQDLQYLTVVPDNHDPDVNYPLVVMLHGFGANMQDLAGLAPAIESEGYVFACPNGKSLCRNNSMLRWLVEKSGLQALEETPKPAQRGAEPI